YWMPGLVLVFGLPVVGYFLLPELLVTRFGLSGWNLWAQAGLWGGIIAGLAFSFYVLKEEIARWYGSLGFLLLTAVVFAFITYLIGGSNSQWAAAAFAGGVVGFFVSFAVYWHKPNMDSAIIVLIVIAALAFIGAVAAILFDLNALQVLQELTLQKLLGYLFSGLAFLIGTPWQDLLTVGQLIGEKVAINEFVAFMTFRDMAADGLLDPRSLVIVSYALCGFANFSSIAIQIGGIGGIAPNRSKDLAKLGLRAMVAGVLASSQTAAVAGVMYGLAEVLGIQLVTLG
ncbi:MAG: nucleoside transporter C-terminal domain-containing protein, partial [bacterium]